MITAILRSEYSEKLPVSSRKIKDFKKPYWNTLIGTKQLEGWGKNGVSFNTNLIILIVVAVRYIKIALTVRTGRKDIG